MAAVVTLRTVWLNLAADPADVLALDSLASLRVTTAQAGEFRPNASGRQRLILRAGQPRAFEITAEHCTRADIAWLEDHIGQIVCVRDDRGRKVFGAYLSVPVEENQYDDEGSLSLSLSEVTYSEAV